jgi:hypothetical protein
MFGVESNCEALTYLLLVPYREFVFVEYILIALVSMRVVDTVDTVAEDATCNKKRI